MGHLNGCAARVSGGDGGGQGLLNSLLISLCCPFYPQTYPLFVAAETCAADPVGGPSPGHFHVGTGAPLTRGYFSSGGVFAAAARSSRKALPKSESNQCAPSGALGSAARTTHLFSVEPWRPGAVKMSAAFASWTGAPRSRAASSNQIQEAHWHRVHRASITTGTGAGAFQDWKFRLETGGCVNASFARFGNSFTQHSRRSTIAAKSQRHRCRRPPAAWQLPLRGHAVPV